MSADVAALIRDSFDLWTSAIDRKSGAGRVGGKKISQYGVERLRALILDLAVRGRLVEQGPGDEPAGALLAKIRSARPRFLADHGLPKQRALSAPLALAPFDVPASWVWTPLGDIAAYMQRGKTPKYGEGSGLFVVSQRCVQWAGLDLSVAKEISEESFGSYEPYRFLQPGDLLWNSTGTGTIGRVIALDEVPDGLVCDSHVTLVRCPWTNARYLQSWLASDAVYGQIEVLAAGSTNQIEWTAQLAMSQLVPLPPLAEQERIVAKVDELMALCDALESQSASALETHQTLVETLLATLINAPDAADLAGQWARLESHFDTLFTTDASVEALRQTVVELAVRGKLVSRDDADEPAGELVRGWKNAKHRALERGGDRRVKSAPDPTNPPFPIPGHWAIQSFENIFLFVDYRGNTPPKTAAGIPLITAKNVRMGYLDREPREYISEATFADWMTRGIPKTGDLFFTTEAPLGNICINDIEEPFAIAQRLICFKPYGVANTRFYMMTIMSRSMQRVLDDSATGMTARGIKAAKLKPIALPVPPDAEQQRIVVKVDELMALCDALKARLATAASTRKHLADAVVERAAA